MSNYTNMKLFSFFYLDENDTLFQGHLVIIQFDKEKDIIKELYEIGPKGLIKKYGKEYIKTQITSNVVNMMVYEYMKPNNQAIKQMKYILKKVFQRENSVSKKTWINGNKNISKEIPNDKEKDTLKNKNSNSINFNLSHYKEQEQKKKKIKCI